MDEIVFRPWRKFVPAWFDNAERPDPFTLEFRTQMDVDTFTALKDLLLGVDTDGKPEEVVNRLHAALATVCRGPSKTILIEGAEGETVKITTLLELLAYSLREINHELGREIFRGLNEAIRTALGAKKNSEPLPGGTSTTPPDPASTPSTPG